MGGGGGEEVFTSLPAAHVLPRAREEGGILKVSKCAPSRLLALAYTEPMVCSQRRTPVSCCSGRLAAALASRQLAAPRGEAWQEGDGAEAQGGRSQVIQRGSRAERLQCVGGGWDR